MKVMGIGGALGCMGGRPYSYDEEGEESQVDPHKEGTLIHDHCEFQDNNVSKKVIFKGIILKEKPGTMRRPVSIR